MLLVSITSSFAYTKDTSQRGTAQHRRPQSLKGSQLIRVPEASLTFPNVPKGTSMLLASPLKSAAHKPTPSSAIRAAPYRLTAMPGFLQAPVLHYYLVTKEQMRCAETWRARQVGYFASISELQPNLEGLVAANVSEAASGFSSSPAPGLMLMPGSAPERCFISPQNVVYAQHCWLQRQKRP